MTIIVGKKKKKKNFKQFYFFSNQAASSTFSFQSRMLASKYKLGSNAEISAL